MSRELGSMFCLSCWTARSRARQGCRRASGPSRCSPPWLDGLRSESNLCVAAAIACSNRPTPPFPEAPSSHTPEVWAPGSAGQVCDWALCPRTCRVPWVVLPLPSRSSTAAPRPPGWVRRPMRPRDQPLQHRAREDDAKASSALSCCPTGLLSLSVTVLAIRSGGGAAFSGPFRGSGGARLGCEASVCGVVGSAAWPPTGPARLAGNVHGC